MTKEFDLSKKILDWKYDMYSDAVVPFKRNKPLGSTNLVIPAEDVKEFIRRLKEEIERMRILNFNKDIKFDIDYVIDKLAGEQLK